MDATIREFVSFIDNLKNPVIELEQPLNATTTKFWKKTFHSVDLKKLTKDIQEYETFLEWWKSRNLTKHFNNTLVKTILRINPPENVKCALLFVIL